MKIEQNQYIYYSFIEKTTIPLNKNVRILATIAIFTHLDALWIKPKTH
jgi:hypothetical protein